MEDVLSTLRRLGQSALATYLEKAPTACRTSLERQLAVLDLDEYFAAVRSVEGESATAGVTLAPEPHEVARRAGMNRRRYAALGGAAIGCGELGFFVVAGGQGSRLGFEHPKGMFPIAPLTGRSLFQIHFEKALGYGRYYGFNPHVFVMTSSTNHAETESFLREHRFFGLKPEHVHLFQQGNLPAVDKSGALLLASPDSLFLAPDGHGGSLRALQRHGMLELMGKVGVRYLSYFQVDNPLVDFCDPVFLGLHMDTGSQVSTKVIRKRDPLEKLGCPVILDGKSAVIEYSDLPEPLARATTAEGELRFAFGSIGIHLFDVDFILSLTAGELRLPFHKAVKAIPHYCPTTGGQVTPASPNGTKLEQFVFDAIPMAQRTLFMETSRELEFAPLKNKEGEDSIATCRAGQTACHRDWLKSAGVPGESSEGVEILPSFACCEEECVQRAPAVVRTLPARLLLG